MTAVEFVISIRDKASSTIEKMATEFARSKSAADKLTSSIGTLQAKGENLKIARDAATSLTELRRLNKEIDQTERKITKLQNTGRGFNAMARDAVTSLPGGAFLTNPLVAAGAGIGIITKLGIENERTTVSFEVLLNSQQKAAKMLKEMNKYADTTPYERMDLQASGKMMLGFGIAAERIMPNIRMLGDIAMGDANKLNSLTMVFSQMSSAGKLNGQDLLQMINAGFNPLNEISKMTGRSIGDLIKDMELGKISSDMVTKAFENATNKGGLFYKMTDRIGETIGGRLSTAIDNLKNVALNLFNVIGPILSPALNIVNFTLGFIAAGMTGLFNLIKAGNPVILGLGIAIGVVTAALGVNYLLTKRAVILAAIKNTWDIVSTITMGILTGAIWAQNAAWMANPVGWVVAGIAALVGVIVLCYNKFEGFRKVVLGVWEVIKNLASVLFELGKGILFFVSGQWGKAASSFGSAFDKIGSAYKKGSAKAIADKAKGDAETIAAVGVSEQELIKNKLAFDNKKKIDELAEKYHALDGKKGAIFTHDRRSLAKQMEAISKGSAAMLNDVNYNGINDDREREKAGNKAASSDVAAGGSRSTAVTINLGKMVENIVFNGGLKENKESLTTQVEEALLRVLYAAQTA